MCFIKASPCNTHPRGLPCLFDFLSVVLLTTPPCSERHQKRWENQNGILCRGSENLASFFSCCRLGPFPPMGQYDVFIHTHAAWASCHCSMLIATQHPRERAPHRAVTQSMPSRFLRAVALLLHTTLWPSSRPSCPARSICIPHTTFIHKAAPAVES